MTEIIDMKEKKKKMTYSKTLDITDAKGAADNIADLKRWGDPDTWKLIAKASSDKEGWMKSTKAMQIDGVGVVLQVTTQQGESIAEALTFVPFAIIVDVLNEDKLVVSRRVDMMGPNDFHDTPG